MKKFLAVVVFCLPAFGQAAYSGPGLYSGPGVYGVSAGAPALYAALPQVWVDNNELTCGITSSCYAGSPGLSLAAPAYELTLGSSSWISGAPPSYCTFSLPYATNGAGLQAAIYAMEGCRSQGILNNAAIGIILDVPPGVYTSTTGGLTIPQTSNTLASAPLIVRSTYDSTLASMPEPVCAGGIQDNVAAPTVTAIGIDNPDCTGTNMYFQNGPQNPTGTITGITTVSVNTTTLIAIAASASAQLVPLTNGYVSPTLGSSSSSCITIDSGSNQECVTPVSGPNQTGLNAVFGKNHLVNVCVVYNVTVAEGAPSGCGNGTGAFTLANGTNTGISAYNYLKYMYQNECNGMCTPVQLCGAVPGDNPQCQGVIGPDHWEFMDGAASLVPGSTSNNSLIWTGDADSQTSLTQFATHIHFRRYWVHGDWTSLATGMNPVSYGLNFNGCSYCSLVGSQGSQLLRPGAEGHVVNVDGINYKINNNWLEGQSSCVFPGGFSTNPGIIGYVPYVNAEFRRDRCQFPYSWLGGSLSGSPISVNGTMNSGSAILIAPTGTFMPGWAGQTPGVPISVTGAGPLNGGGNPTTLYATILSYQNSGQVTLSTSASTATSGATIGLYPNAQWTGSVAKKNCLELKEGENVLISGLICDGNDNSGAQNGTVATIDIRNTSGSENGASIGDNYQSTLQDFTLQDSIFRNSCEGIDEGARGPADSGVTHTAARERFADILQYAISGSNPGCNGETVGMMLDQGSEYWNAVVTETSTGIATAVAFASIDAGVSLTEAGNASGGSTVYTTTGNTAAQNAALCDAVDNGRVFVSGFTTPGNNSTYTGFVCAASSSTSLTLTNSGGVAEIPTGSPTANPILSQTSGYGFRAIDIRAGEAVSITNCGGGTDYNGTGNSAFNQPMHTINGTSVPVSMGPPATTGSTEWNGKWSSANDTVVYNWPGASAGAFDDSGSCILTNIESSPPNVSLLHITFVGDAIQSIGSGPTPSKGPPFIFNHLFQDSILLSQFAATNAGWYNSAVASPKEGTQTEIFNYDANSLTADHLVWAGRPAGNYTAYGNNPNYTVASPVMYFPATDFCTGSTYSSSGSNCVAFKGAMSITPVVASITATAITNDVLTVTANNFFPVGQTVILSGTAESYLNGQSVTVATASSTQFTANFNHANESNSSDSGSATIPPMPLTLPDYHGYELRSDSPYSATGATPASDGTDIGARIPNIDSAMTQNLFVCPGSCGSPGPFPD